MKEHPIKAWHFLNNDCKLGYKDGRTVRKNQWLKAKGDISLCRNGMHASLKLLDALRCASNAKLIVCRVEVCGEIQEGRDKLVGRKRRVIAWCRDTKKVERVLHEFGLWCAERALKRTDNPDPRSLEALRVKRLWLDGKASNQELWAAADAADAAAYAADAADADAAAYAAVYAADAAAYAAADAAYAAADAAYAAADAAYAAADAAADAAARAAERKAQERKLRDMIRKVMR